MKSVDSQMFYVKKLGPVMMVFMIKEKCLRYANVFIYWDTLQTPLQVFICEAKLK